jgi:hypothetical protein
MCVPGAGAGDVPEGCCAVAIPVMAMLTRKTKKRDILSPRELH